MNELLRDLERQARELEVANRYDSQDTRTVVYTIDPTRYSPHAHIQRGRLELRVVARYPDWAEKNAFFGRKGPMQRKPPEMWLAYILVFEGIGKAVVRRKQALRAMETRKVPRGVSIYMPEPLPTPTPEELGRLLAKIGGPAVEIAPRRRKTAGGPPARRTGPF